MTDKPYGCQEYDIKRLCRFDRRALDRKCDGCQRTTDRAYLESQGLWVIGVSHALPVIQAESSLFVGNAGRFVGDAWPVMAFRLIDGLSGTD